MNESMKNFDFQGLFSDRAPGPIPFKEVKRQKFDFAVAYPDPYSIPINELEDCLRLALNNEGRDLAVYPHLQGYPPLREYVSNKLKQQRGIDVSEDEIILADGSSQPIHIVIESLLNPGDVVITEEYVYSGTLNTLRRFGADVRGVSCDDDGMDMDMLEGTIELAISQGKHPKLIYSIPTFQNPQGWTMSLKQRKQLIEIAQTYRIPVLEDDCYVDLRFEGEDVKSLHSIDESGLVIYVGSFSKIIAPGMRLGYLTGPEEFLSVARALKSGGGVNQFAALAVHRFATGGLDTHIDDLNRILITKRDAMLSALGENMGSNLSWSKPEGALYIWLRLPDHADTTLTVEPAGEVEVGYHPGVNFAPDGISGKNFARLCYGYNTTDEIQEGIARLAEVFDTAGYI